MSPALQKIISNGEPFNLHYFPLADGKKWEAKTDNTIEKAKIDKAHDYRFRYALTDDEVDRVYIIGIGDSPEEAIDNLASKL